MKILQSHLYGIEIAGGGVYLKENLKLQSHLYGIEISFELHRTLVEPKLQSHLYGIEILQNYTHTQIILNSNRTFMELKFYQFI